MPIRHIPDPSLTQPPSAFPEILDRAIAAAEAKGEKLDLSPFGVTEGIEEAAKTEVPTASIPSNNNNKKLIALVVLLVVLPVIVFLFFVFLLFLGGVIIGVMQSG